MSENTLVHRVARQVVRPLASTSVTPNQLTTLRLVTGVAAAVCYAIGTAPWALAGSVLFLFSCFLDRADGELARLTKQESLAGDDYDVACDIVSNILIFVGVGMGLRHGELGNLAILMGVISGAAIAAIYYGMILIERVQGDDIPVVDIGGSFDADDFLFIIGPLTWLGWLEPFLWITVTGSPLFALWIYWRWLRLRQTGPFSAS